MTRKQILLSAGGSLLLGVVLWMVWSGGSAENETAPANGPVASSRDGQEKEGRGRVRKTLRKIAAASVHGLVLDDSGEALPGALVLLSRSSESIFGLAKVLPVTTFADEQGRWSYENVQPGSFRLTASLEEYLADESVELKLSAGEKKEDVTIVLQRGGHALSGTITDVGGGGISGAVVVAHRSEGFMQTVYSVAMTDDSGRYKLQLAADGYNIVVSHEDYVEKSQALRLVSPRTLDMLLVPAASVHGQVVTSEGEAVPNAKVYAIDSRSARNGSISSGTADTDESGRFILKGLGSGRYSLSAVAPGVATDEPVKIDLGIADTIVGIEIVVTRAHSIFGQVVEAEDSSQGVEGVQLMALDMRTQKFVVSLQNSDKDGQFEIPGVLPGSYMVMAYHDELLGSFMETHVTMVDKDIDDLTISLKRGSVLRGRVEPPMVTEVGLRVEEVGILNMKEAMMAESAKTHSDKDGIFEITQAPAGDFILSAIAEDGRKAEIPVSVVSGVQEGLVLTLVEGRTLSGRVVDQRGQPVLAVRVVLEKKDGKSRMMFSAGNRSKSGYAVNDKGEFRIRGLDEGVYTLEVRDSRGSLPWVGADDPNLPKEITIGSRDISNRKLSVERADGEIIGVVLNSDGRPMADVWVEATRGWNWPANTVPVPAGIDDESGNAPDAYQWGEREEPVLTDTDGRFVVANLRSGSYQLVANAPTGGDRGMLKDVSIGDEVTLKLVALTELRVVVVQAGGLSDLRIRLSRPGQPEQSHDVPAGTNEHVFTRLAPGMYKVSASNDLASASESVSVGSEPITRVELELQAWCGVKAKILDVYSGQPIVGALIFNPNGAESDSEQGMNLFTGGGQKTDDAGRLEISKLFCGPGVLFLMKGMIGTPGGGQLDFVTDVGMKDLGVVYQAMKKAAPAEQAGSYGFSISSDDGDTASVTDVKTGGVASKAGIVVGDKITKLLGIEIEKLSARVRREVV
ncbi:MAG: carboxypeptidase regulatory-like domain-containing protein, partial [Kofleriaceae bacterium]|nr:carboxypeptidase regulatory-like domain-containing protein [Kofleriaceae bacterium]